MPAPLTDLAKVIRSKNSGPFELSLDILFKDDDMYRRVKSANVFTPARVARLYRVEETRVLAVTYFDAARAVKIVLERTVSSGDLGERDVYGAQQHAPLLGMEIAL